MIVTIKLYYLCPQCVVFSLDGPDVVTHTPVYICLYTTSFGGMWTRYLTRRVCFC